MDSPDENNQYAQSAICPRNLAGAFSERAKGTPGKKRRPDGSLRAGEGSDTIQVVARVRPPKPALSSAKQEPDCVEVLDAKCMRLYMPAKIKDARVAKQAEGGSKTYEFSKVFSHKVSQEDFYQATAAPMVEELITKPNDYVMMAYGITGAGKTFTIEGRPDNPGVVGRTLEQLFSALEALGDSSLKVCISYYEVYKDHVYDLLAPATASGKRAEVRVMEDSKGSVCLPGLMMRPVSSAAEALAAQREGGQARRKAATALNAGSSRSHAILTVVLCQSMGNDGAILDGRRASGTQESLAARSRLSFVDLAGSERAHRANNSGERFREAVAINHSLMTLGRCLEALRHNQANPGKAQRMIPYRDAKITHIFRDALHGAGHIVLAVCVSPDSPDYSETAHVLEYARTATEIRTVAARPQQPDAPAPPASASKRARLAGTPPSQRPQGGGGGMLPPRDACPRTTPRRPCVEVRRSTVANTSAGPDPADAAAAAAANAELVKERSAREALERELEAARRSALEHEVLVRREVTEKMQESLAEMEGYWRGKIESLQAKNEQLLGSAEAAVAETAAAAAAAAAVAADKHEEDLIKLRATCDSEMEMLAQEMTVMQAAKQSALKALDAMTRERDHLAQCLSLMQNADTDAEPTSAQNGEVDGCLGPPSTQKRRNRAREIINADDAENLTPEGTPLGNPDGKLSTAKSDAGTGQGVRMRRRVALMDANAANTPPISARTRNRGRRA